MKTTAVRFLVLAVCALIPLYAPLAEPLVSEAMGFQIDPLDSASAETAQPTMMFLPASDGFSPNVNVQVQNYPGTLQAYLALTLRQFQQYGFELLDQRIDEDGLTIEYRGVMQGRPLRWYARAVRKDRQVYLVTATAAESQWSDVSDKLIDCVSSFRLLDTP